MERKCNICKSPWHPASGHYISDTMVWCGPCTQSWVKELCGNQHRRWGGLKFYAHATVPPPAVNKTFVFTVFTLVPGSTCRYAGSEVEKSGVTFEEALQHLNESHPQHHVAEHLKGLWKEKT